MIYISVQPAFSCFKLEFPIHMRKKITTYKHGHWVLVYSYKIKLLYPFFGHLQYIWFFKRSLHAFVYFTYTYLSQEIKVTTLKHTKDTGWFQFYRACNFFSKTSELWLQSHKATSAQLTLKSFFDNFQYFVTNLLNVCKNKVSVNVLTIKILTFCAM